MTDLVRIGDKLISRQRIDDLVTRVLGLRSKGLSQQDVAERLGIDRPFISRLESLGEVRKGRRIAVVGFPLGNRGELEAVARKEGVDFTLLMSESERKQFLEQRTGAELLNDIMNLAASVRDHEVVILLGSDWRMDVIEALLGRETIKLPLGVSPITEDRTFDPREFRRIIRSVRLEDQPERKETAQA